MTPQVGQPLLVEVVIEPLLVERLHSLVMTKQARLQNSLLLLKRGVSFCREVKIIGRLVLDWLEARCRS